MNDFFQRLRQRKLGQWALAYAAGAWVALQVLGFLASAYGWSASTLRIGTGVAITGFPIVLVLGTRVRVPARRPALRRDRAPHWDRGACGRDGDGVVEST